MSIGGIAHQVLQVLKRKLAGTPGNIVRIAADGTVEDSGKKDADYAAVFYAKKTADETVNNSDVLQDDDHLTGLAVAADSVWHVRLTLKLTTTSDADFKFKLNPSASGAEQYITWTLWGAGGFSQPLISGHLAGADPTVSIPVTNSITGVMLEVDIIVDNTGQSAKTYTLQWAQDTAQATDTTVGIYSCMEAWRVKGT